LLLPAFCVRLPTIKPKTRELLNFLLWSAELLTKPAFRNLTDSYEAWAYRKGLFRQLDSLEKQQLLESDPEKPNQRVYRLTEQGRLESLGGRDPEARWSRNWDGRWRLVLFDLPITQNARRERLRRYLRNHAFGYLQNMFGSVQIPWRTSGKSFLAARSMWDLWFSSKRGPARTKPIAKL